MHLLAILLYLDWIFFKLKINGTALMKLDLVVRRGNRLIGLRSLCSNGLSKSFRTSKTATETDHLQLCE